MYVYMYVYKIVIQEEDILVKASKGFSIESA